jgi:hypothetical protein
MVKKKLRKTIVKHPTQKTFSLNTRYEIHWTNLMKSVVSKGTIVDIKNKATKFICFKDDFVKASIIIPLKCITKYKKL